MPISNLSQSDRIKKKKLIRYAARESKKVNRKDIVLNFSEINVKDPKEIATCLSGIGVIRIATRNHIVIINLIRMGITRMVAHA